jgi:hypothetical protein
VVERKAPMPHWAVWETVGPREATEGTARPHVAVRGRAAQAGPREVTQGTSRPHVAVRGGRCRQGRARRLWERRGRTWQCGGGRRRQGRARRRSGRTGGDGGHRIEVEEHVELGERGSGGGGKREIRLIENDVARNEDSVGGEVKTPLTLMVGRVTEEDTARVARGKLMSSGSEIGVASAPEDTKMVVRGLDAEESEVRGGVGNRLGGETIEKVGGSGEGLNPVTSGKGSLEE